MAPPSRSGSHPGRTLAALGVLLLIMFVSITGSQTFNPSNWHKQFKVGLGLDLSSGNEIVLQASTQNHTAPTATSMQQAITILESRVNHSGSSGAQVQQTAGDELTVTVPGQTSKDISSQIANTDLLFFRPVYLEQAYQVPVPSTTPSASGTASPSATPSGSATPSSTAKPAASPAAKTSSSPTAASSPKASTQDESAKVATTAKAAATPAASAKASGTPAASAKATGTAAAAPSPAASATPTTATSTAAGDPSKVDAATQALFNKLVCKPAANGSTQVDDSWQKSVGYTNNQFDNPNAEVVSCDAQGDKYVLGKAVFAGTDVSTAQAALESTNSQWVVSITLDGKAKSSFGTLTTSQYNTYCVPQGSTCTYGSDPTNNPVLDETAVQLGGDVQSAPQTQGALTTGQFEINGGSGGFTQAQANDLANLLKYGELPLHFKIINTSTVSAQTGSNSLHAGLLAGLLGLILVVIYLFYYYRGLGIVSISSLLIAALAAYLTVVLLSRYQNFTMSLAAIAGLVVSVGITADSFIVYFERLRDEVREGKALRPAVEAGWKRARRTILISNTVSFIGALLLYHFAVSDVQGFAYTLGLTTIINVLVVFLFTKPFVTILAGTKFFSSGHKWSGLDPERLGGKARSRKTTVRNARPHRTAATRSFGEPSASSTTSKEA